MAVKGRSFLFPSFPKKERSAGRRILFSGGVMDSQSAGSSALAALEGCGSVIGELLSPAERQKLAACAYVKEYPVNGSIFREGDAATSMALLLSGEAKLSKAGPHGRECVLCLIRPGRIIDPAAPYYESGFPASASAVKSCRVLHLPCREVRRLAETCPALGVLLIRALSSRHRLFINKTAESQGVISVPRRVASWLLHRRKMEKSVAIELVGTRELLARLLGVSRESLSRELNGLARSGVIALERRSITILDEAALRKAAQE